MKILVVSDIHCEMDHWNQQDVLPDAPADVLVLAGDICTARHMDKHIDFFRYCSEHYPEVLYVLGNHEHYHYDIAKTYNDITNKLKQFTNIHVLENQLYVVGGVTFFGCTLWTDCDNHNPVSTFNVSRSMNDFYIIRNSKSSTSRFTIEQSFNLFDQSKQKIIEAAKNCQTDKFVVITHHGCSTASIDQQYINSTINGGFVSDLSDLILDHEINLWIHGHIHNSKNYMCGDTNVVVNPAGYPFYDGRHDPMIYRENPEYNRNLIVEI